MPLSLMQAHWESHRRPGCAHRATRRRAVERYIRQRGAVHSGPHEGRNNGGEMHFDRVQFIQPPPGAWMCLCGGRATTRGLHHCGGVYPVSFIIYIIYFVVYI
eukprot:Filipodium_phascolosomae@DN2840_c0_g1_i1.p1